MDWSMLLAGEESLKSGTVDRNTFERDYDRILFSHPFRRLQDKTQVFPLPEQDFVHTRLTHSLEVSSVGRSLGRRVGESILKKHPELSKMGYQPNHFGAIVSAACLTHDLGNPPFGHTGEDAISDFFRDKGKGFQSQVSEGEWQDLINFEGNAQGFRILAAQSHGLKLSDQTLAAFTKYPRPSDLKNIDPRRRSQKKYGYFQSEKEAFTGLANNLGLIELNAGNAWCRYPLAFLVEAADDICYHIIDLEDGCRLGLVREDETIGLLSQILGAKYKPSKLRDLPHKDERIGLMRALSIGVLIEQAAQVFLENEQDILSSGFDHSLIGLMDSEGVLKEIIKLSSEKLYRSTAVLEIEAAGFEVLGGLLETFTFAASRTLFSPDQATKRDKSILRLLPKPYHGNENPYEMLRGIIDFISGLTDRHALSLYRKLKGIALPGTRL